VEPGRAEEVFRGRIFSVERLSVPGASHPYEVVRHPGSAAVLPITPAGDAILVEQLRPPIGGPLVEIPAGLLDVAGEDPLTCAARELFEETGYRHQTIEFLGGCFLSAGLSDEYSHLFVARTLAEAEGEPEEDIAVLIRPLHELVRSARAGRIRDAKTALTVLLADARGWGSASSAGSRGPVGSLE
jgi:ADP-ribose pyrophosphatase